MKKSKETLGDVLPIILSDILKVSIVIAAIIFVVKAVNQFNSGNTSLGIMYIAILLGCVFLFWLILTINSIAVSMKEINNNFNDLFNMQRDFLKVYYNQKLKKDHTSEAVSNEEISTET